MSGASAAALVPMVVAHGRTVHVDGTLRHAGETVILSPDDTVLLHSGGFVVPPGASSEMRRVDFTMPKRDRTDVPRDLTGKA